MKLISHRGNINGRLENLENEPTYIDIAINMGYDVEVDVWVLPEHKNLIFLGHDKAQYSVTMDFFKKRIDKLWIHCKNIGALYLFNNSEHNFNYFWHQEDDFTLSSYGLIWTFPGKKLTINSICVMPELCDISKDMLPECFGVCSNFIDNFK